MASSSALADRDRRGFGRVEPTPSSLITEADVTRARRACCSLAVAVVAVGCGVLELGGVAHEAVTLEDTRADGADLVVVVELLATQIGGVSVVELRADADEVTCTDGRDQPPAELPLGSELVFVKEGDVPTGEPPRVTGLEVQMDCG
jgi:hypothetical protein